MELDPQYQQPRQAALVLGIVLIIIGVIAFIPGVTVPPRIDAPLMKHAGAYGYLIGLFPVNWLLNTLRILLGVGGLAASFRFVWSRGYLVVMTWFFAACVVFGIIPGLRTLGGFMPLYGDDVWLHTVALAVVGFYSCGWAVKAGKSPDFSNA